MSESAVAEATQAPAPATQPAATESAPSTEVSEGLSLLAEIEGKATQGSEEPKPTGESTAPEAAAEPDEVTALVDAAKKSAAEEAVTKDREERDQTTEIENRYRETEGRLQGIQQDFQARAPRLRAGLTHVLNNLVNGETVTDGQGRAMSNEDVVNWALNEFTQHHGQSLTVAQSEYAQAFYEAAAAALPEEDRQAFINNRRNHGSFTAALKDRDARLTKAALTGHYTQAQLDEAKAKAVVQLNHKWETDEAWRTQRLSRTNTAQSRQGTPTGGEPRNLAEAEQMHSGMHPSGKTITSAEMRALKARHGWQ